MIAYVILIASITSTLSKSSPKLKDCKREIIFVIIRYGYMFFINAKDFYRYL